jgi:hypothetical protein
MIQEKITARKEWKKLRPYIMVGIVGTEAHIGATHTALLTAKFLASVGFRAAYLETNPRRNLPWLARVYPVSGNEKKHLLQYKGVDMYFEFKFQDIVSAGYDFLVFDFGRCGELEPASFLTKDIQLAVGGMKPWELPAYKTIIDSLRGSRNLRFVVNFAPESERESVRNLLTGFTTYFTDYAPDPFAAGVNLAMYKDVFADFISVDQIPARAPEREKPKKGLFGWR